VGWNLAEEVVEHSAVKTCVRKGWANRVDETPMEAGGVTLSWEQLICNWHRPGVESQKGTDVATESASESVYDRRSCLGEA
jgi:hypothetical protein